MKVLLVNKFFYPKGGAETVYLQERDMLLAEGIQVIEFAMQHEKNLPSDYQDFFVSNVDYHNENAGVLAKFKAAKDFIINREACDKFAALVEQEKPDIVHFHNIYHQLTPAIIKIAKQFGCKTVLTAHDYKIPCPSYTMFRDGAFCDECLTGSVFNATKHRCMDGSLSKSVLLSLEAGYQNIAKHYHQLDLVLSPSEFLARMIRRKLPDTRVDVLVNGIDENIHSEQYQDNNYFVCVGRLSAEKGVATLLRAHQQMQNKSTGLKIVGTGPLYDELVAQYPDAEFCGFQSGQALEDLIKQSRAVVVPSECNENCSMSIIEAMAYGKAIIGSNVGGIPEQVREGVEGALFESGNAEQLAQVLDRFALNAEIAEQMGQRARQRLEEKYSLAQHKKVLLGYYQQLLTA